jgi:hypothetical protein
VYDEARGTSDAHALVVSYYSWKGIPYATPPIGDLRFKAPRSLTSQAGKTPVDVSDDALRCVQFGAPSNIVGVKSGPGVEVTSDSTLYRLYSRLTSFVRPSGLPQALGLETNFSKSRRQVASDGWVRLDRS